VRAGLACSPCYLRLLSRCPHNHDCMNNVAAAAVIERAEKALGNGAKGGTAAAPARRRQ